MGKVHWLSDSLAAVLIKGNIDYTKFFQRKTSKNTYECSARPNCVNIIQNKYYIFVFMFLQMHQQNELSSQFHNS